MIQLKKELVASELDFTNLSTRLSSLEQEVIVLWTTNLYVILSSEMWIRKGCEVAGRVYAGVKNISEYKKNRNRYIKSSGIRIGSEGGMLLLK